MNFKKWVKSIQNAGYNGVRAVDGLPESVFSLVCKQKIFYDGKNKHTIGN